MYQTSLFALPVLVHGGELASGKRKKARPLARKRPIHLVLKATGSFLLKHEREILKLAHDFAAKYGIDFYDKAVNRDHLHFVIRIPGRQEYCRFIRAFTSVLARRLGKGLWLLKPFTRIATWGRDYLRLKSYLKQNREEAHGLRPYKPRKDYYRTRCLLI